MLKEVDKQFKTQTDAKLAKLNKMMEQLHAAIADVNRILVRSPLDSQVTEKFMEKEDAIADLLLQIDLDSKNHGLGVKIPGGCSCFF